MADEKNMTIQEEILTLSNLEEEEEDRAVYIKRLIVHGSKLKNEDWEELTQKAQDWINNGIEQINAGSLEFVDPMTGKKGAPLVISTTVSKTNLKPKEETKVKPNSLGSILLNRKPMKVYIYSKCFEGIIFI